MKSIWNGSVSFGLVNIPVKLYSAVESKAFSFRMLDSKHHSRIQYRRVSSKTGEEVAWADIVKGIEISKGKYFVPTKEQLAAIRPEKSDTIDIVGFVDQGQIDPLYLHSHYYVGPGKAKEKSYFLFKEVLHVSAKVALGRFVMREKEYVCAIAAYQEGLLLTTLNYAYEIRDIKEVDNLKSMPKIRPQELTLAEELINKLYQKQFDITEFRDTFAQGMEKMMKRVAKGEVIEEAKVKRKSRKEENLIAALKASLD